ncbi:hypothetical protein [Rhizobium sp. RU36D]|uniref:hypothetical protein n=1 Tax=Rhizobium sp. RU36D TaxID=1907415 RepID=UPI0009D89271|nr:hypothetical protein [Rhizobium sp. RU36D]SMC53323.1 hypothetical protein SAMN05880593_102254 [Rhizobium sp. RU36D]
MHRSSTYKMATDAERNRRSERALMRQLFLISYPLCLIAAITHRIALYFDSHASRPDQSVFAEARSAAYAAVGYAFHA